MLDFIRRNSIIVVVAIVAVAAGLIISDYAGKGSSFSGDYNVQVNGKGYTIVDQDNIGRNAVSHLQELYRMTLEKYRAPFDLNGDGQLDEKEQQTFATVISGNPEAMGNLNYFDEILSAWSMGSSQEAELNILTTRMLIREEGEVYGIAPDKEQVDAFIRALPAFRKNDGGFDQEAYFRVCGYRKGQENREGERSFRNLISDLMIWQSLQALLTNDLAYYAPAEEALVDVEAQELLLKTAWLPRSRFAPSSEPSEEDLKAFWEQHRNDYKSDEKRIISLYTVKGAPKKDGTMPTEEELTAATDNYTAMLSASNAKGMDGMLEPASKDEEFVSFTYEKTTFGLAARNDLPAPLQAMVDTGREMTPLGDIAFEVAKAPTVEAYEKDKAAGMLDERVTLEQLRGFYPLQDGTQALVRVEAILAPEVLPYEEARAQALANLKEQMTDKALQEAADDLHARMTEAAAGEGLAKAFQLAEAAGAEVAPYGPVQLGTQDTLPEGLNVGLLATVKTGAIAPLMPAANGVRIAAVESRSVVDSPQAAAFKSARILPARNAQLRRKMMIDWLEHAYRHYQVQFGPHVKMH